MSACLTWWPWRGQRGTRGAEERVGRTVALSSLPRAKDELLRSRGLVSPGRDPQDAEGQGQPPLRPQSTSHCFLHFKKDI